MDSGAEPPEFPLHKGDDVTVATASDYILPPLTPAILEEYQKEQALKAQLEKGRRMDQFMKSKLGCFGIPSCLMLVMICLILAVVGGTIAAVLLYDSSEGVQPPSDAPTMIPS